jgi:hypothetical protein
VNSKGQFSIIAALLVAVVLIGTVITTYATLRYSTIQDQPQVLSAIDETNLALDKVLGFTVGYYGSVLQVTGDTVYAQNLTKKYLNDSLGSIADIKPEWGASFSLVSLDLSANWFTNSSYSAGEAVVKYDLPGLGISGMSYTTSCRLDVQVSNSSSTNQACLSVFKDGSEPVINLGNGNFKFYRYLSNVTWGFEEPSGELTAFANGTYLVGIPSGIGIDSSSYVIQVTDTRGILVAAASFSRITASFMWNTTTTLPATDYVDINTTDVDSSPNKGTQSNFPAQQYGPDSINDNLTEGAFGTVTLNYNATNYNLIDQTTFVSGLLSALQSNDGVYMGVRSYVSAYSGASSDFGHKTAGSSTSDFSSIRGSRFTCTSSGRANSITAYLNYTPPSGTFGNTGTGSSNETIMDTIRGQRFTSPAYSVIAQNIEAYLDVLPTTFGNTATGTNYQSISNCLRGSPFQASETGTIQSISAYIYVTSTNRHIKAAIYTTTGTLVGSTSEVTGLSGGAQWATFTFSGTKPSLTSGTTYILVVWADSGMSSVYLYYSSTSTDAGRNYTYTYQNWPSPVTFNNDTNLYCIYCAYQSSMNMKAAIYDNSGNIVASTDQLSVPASTSAAWQTFTFASPPTLAASTQYVLVVWSQSGGGGASLRYATGSGNGRYASQTYGDWPSPATFSTNTHNYCIYCNYQQVASAVAQAAIYSSDGTSRLGITEEKALTTTTGSWVTFNFVSQPVLTASTNYVLVLWASDTSNVNIFYDNGAEYFRGSGTYPNWPNSVSDQSSQRAYSIYCTYTPASEYTCEVEFVGNSDTLSWTQLAWITDSKCTTEGVAVTAQLYNYQLGRYALSGEDGYNSATIGTTDVPMTQTITVNPTAFRSGTGGWILKFKAVKSTPTQFDANIDLVRYSPDAPNYALDIEEQWTNVYYAYPRQGLCIKTGACPESLMVDVRVGSSWVTVINSLLANQWNNVSVTPYINLSTLTFRFRGSNDNNDTSQTSWNIDAVLLSPQPDIDTLLKPLDHTIVVELLQNGTMRWLGQNLTLTTQGKPIPPIPVKAIHVNQTINGVNQEVPFQVEDWASNYSIPLGLTNNATVFSNRQMIVYLINVNVSKVTVWWNGSDTATQTPLAYTNRYFSYTSSNRTLSNSRLSIQFEETGFNVTSWVGSTKLSTASFMRINTKEDTTNPELSYVTYTGAVRAIVQGEPEWSSGITNCSNVYANIVYTLPANATYFTYQLRLMFVNSTGRPRNMTDLCPIKLLTTLTLSTIQTENGTINTSPIVASGTGTFKNYGSGDAWTAHHWSQFNSTTGTGAGIMFTNASNQLLYAFDPTATGSLNVSTTAKTIEFSPVTQPTGQVYPFTTPNTYEITWHGAIATFDSTKTTTPVYTLQDTAPTGLWLLVEYPPKVTVISES